MSGDGLASFDPVASLLGDLDTITTLAQSAARPDTSGGLVPGETRPAAILLVDIVGFTPLAQVLGPEALSQLVDRCFRIFELTVQAQGGYCDKLIGDAGLYVFAGHVSYAPPCQGALRSALEIQRRVNQINESLQGGAGVTPVTGQRPAPPQLQVRCGISFGEVARQRIGGDQQQFTVMGTAVNLAQRLEGAAVPGTICTVAEVLEETGTLFEAVPLGARELKGLGTRELFTVTGENARQVQLRGRGQISPLVGRDELLANAAGVVEGWLKAEGQRPKAEVKKNKGRLLVLRGATAVGKSRLAWELTKLLGVRHELALATAHCTPHGGLLGFAAELCKVAGLTADNVATRWAELCALSVSEGAGPSPRPGEGRGPTPSVDTLMQQLPLLAYVLGSGAVDTAAIRQGDSAAFSSACKTALASCIELAAREGRQPLLVVEDVQWLGELSDVLTHLLNVELEVPLVVIATARVAATDEMLASLVGDPERLHVIEVGALNVAQGRQLLAELLPGAGLPAALEAELHEKSLGLPYYYEEAARMLLRRGVVAPVGEALMPPTGAMNGSPTYEVVGALDSLPIPDDLRTLILGRLDTLPTALRELAQHASVLGRSFELDDLLALEARIGSADCGAVCAALGALQQERILHQDLEGGNAGVMGGTGGGSQASTTASSATRYFFTHVLTQEAAYTSLLSVNRRQLHGAAGDIAAAQHVPGTAAEWDLLPQLYEHYERAGRWENACNVACDVLMLLIRNKSWGRWDQWEKRACEAKAATCDPVLEARYLWALGTKASAHKDFDEAHIRLESALLISQECAEKVLQASLMIDLAALVRDNFDLPLAEGYLREALKLADEVDSHTIRADALYRLGGVYKRQGQIEAAIECFIPATEEFTQLGNFQNIALALNSLGSCYIDQDKPELANDSFARASAAATKSGNLMLDATIAGNIGISLQKLGRANEALSAYRQALQKSQAISWNRGEAYNYLNLGDLQLELGLFDNAEQSLRQALDLFPALNDIWGEGNARGTLADVLIRQGSLEEAQKLLLQADELLSRTGDQYRRALYQCTRVRLNIASGELSAAKSSLTRARALSSQAPSGVRSFLDSEIAKADEQIKLALAQPASAP